MALEYTVRPISDRTQFTGPAYSGNRNPFDASWSSTLKLLEHELAELDARHVVLEMDVLERHIRADGMLRADARTSSPAVRLAFDSKHGPLVYATDRFGWNYADQPYSDGWKQNVRAIALGLEALRRVDRYGITSRAEQYRGFKAIGAGTGAQASAMTTDEAARVLADASGQKLAGFGTAAVLSDLARAARAATHPDRHDGDRTAYDLVDQAVQVLTRAGLVV